MELRLKKRHAKLVRSHMNVGHELAAGVKSTLNKDIAFSQTQAAWRFFNNDKCSLESLSLPLLEAAQELSEQECSEYLLLPHDWSHIGFNKHESKKDTFNTFKKCVGYELHSTLAISDKHGGPLAPIVLNLKTKNETHSSYNKELHGLTHLEELSKRISWIEMQGFCKKLVHIVDREGDSVALFRALRDKNWLIRVNGSNYAHDVGGYKKIEVIGKSLAFSFSRDIRYKGKRAQQLIGETEVTISRAAKPKRRGTDGKRQSRVAGDPVRARLIVSKVVDMAGAELATWYLLSNLFEVSAPTLALWYYWRWSIETFFKLLKTAGMQLESWQQTTGAAVARRLLVASMACVWVWRIAHAKGAEAGELRQILTRLSGRQMKWKKEFTCSAMCAGLWVLLSMLDMLENYDIDKLKSLISSVLGEKKFV